MQLTTLTVKQPGLLNTVLSLTAEDNPANLDNNRDIID